MQTAHAEEVGRAGCPEGLLLVLRQCAALAEDKAFQNCPRPFGQALIHDLLDATLQPQHLPHARQPLRLARGHDTVRIGDPPRPGNAPSREIFSVVELSGVPRRKTPTSTERDLNPVATCQFRQASRQQDAQPTRKPPPCAAIEVLRDLQHEACPEPVLIFFLPRRQGQLFRNAGDEPSHAHNLRLIRQHGNQSGRGVHRAAGNHIGRTRGPNRSERRKKAPAGADAHEQKKNRQPRHGRRHGQWRRRRNVQRM